MKRAGTYLVRLLVVVAVGAAALVSLGPFAWVVCASVKSGAEALSPGLLPWDQISRWAGGEGAFPLTLENYRVLLGEHPYLTWAGNSLFLSATHTLATVLLSSLGGFALARYRFTGQRLLMGIMVLTMLLPSQVLLPSSYELMYRLGWVDSYLAILVPGAVSIFGLFLFRQAMRGVPEDLLAAARMDGCSELRIWWEIAMPVVRPVTGAYTLMSFLSGWNSYLWPQVILQEEGKFTLPIGLANMAGLQGLQGEYGVLMAGTVLSILPVMVLFLWLQREFVEGLTVGAVKG